MNVPTSADVVVAGTGIVGCATAYALAKRGLKVVLVDKGSVGAAVSGASLACIGAHMVDIGELPLLQAACDLWRGYPDELGRDIEYQRCGQLRFIAREGDFVAARRWLDQERAGHSLPIQPRKAQCLATMRLPPTIPCVVGACEAGGGVEAGYTQIQQARSGQVLFNTVLGGGLRNAGALELEPSIDQAFVRDSVRTLLWLFPDLEDVMLLRSWARYEAVTPDDRFLVGPVSGLEGFLMAAGDNGVGFTRAPLIAKALVEIIADGGSKLDIGCYDPERFTALPEEAERIGNHG